MVIIDIVKIFIAATLSFFIGIAITPALTNFLYSHKMWKKKCGKIGLDGKETPIFNELHKEKEVGTPRMGGIIIWLATTITIVGMWILAHVFPNEITSKLDFLSRNQTWIPFVTMLIGAFVGLIDDYFEIAGKTIGGLSLKKRLLVVGFVSLLCGIWFYTRLGVTGIGTPWGELYIGWLIVPFFILLSMLFYSGGVIDGIDGLAGGVFSIIFSAYGIIAIHQQQINLATFCFALTGAILAFLWFNIPPARFYMSETGSMALTITLAVVVFMAGTPKNGYGIFVFPIIALPLLVTTLSVIIQMLSKKLRNGKKVFLVAPLHHHFEAKGWPSYKVTMRYWILTIIFAIIGVTIAFLGKPL
jgi:phospho-N-acetylmuramoyl-pentapeptide-transferase